MIKAFLSTIILLITAMLFVVPATIFAEAEVADTSETTAYHSEPKEPENAEMTGFAKGTRKWQTYGSALVGDSGKGEMYALHLGYGYFPWNRTSVNVDIFGAYIRSGIDDNGVAGGLDLIFRRHFFTFEDERYSLYGDIGGGFEQQSTYFAGSRKFNFRVMAGFGGTVRISDKVRLMGGARYLHISDAGIEGGGGGYDGIQFYLGGMFPF